MAFDFLKRLLPRVRRGAIVFREAQWDAPKSSPIWDFVQCVKEEVRVVEVARGGGLVRVTCDCDQFEPIPRGAPVPLYFPSVSFRQGGDGDRSAEVTFTRKGAGK